MQSDPESPSAGRQPLPRRGRRRLRGARDDEPDHATERPKTTNRTSIPPPSDPQPEAARLCLIHRYTATCIGVSPLAVLGEQVVDRFLQQLLTAFF
jgi:hypothetical protein